MAKGWDWTKVAGENREYWLKADERCVTIAERWRNNGPNNAKLLDMGCGLCRHSILFANRGFEVSAIDISEAAIEASRTNSMLNILNVDVRQGDFKVLPYEDNTFNYVLCYHALNHGDTMEVISAINEIYRVLKPGGEVYLTLGSKLSWQFTDTDWPEIDENTKIRMEDGPEYGVPHFYANRSDINNLFWRFYIEQLEESSTCFFESSNICRTVDTKPVFHFYGLFKKY